VDQQLVDDARIVVSELLCNALRHARAAMDGALTVEVEVSVDNVTIAVADGGSATLPAVTTPLPLSPSGRGLAIVRTLTSSWGVREGAAGNVVYGVLSRG
jgi:anti-sigma regulatory factor (Ser/Thr protein kinase)